jgi:hypothetical protein
VIEQPLCSGLVFVSSRVEKLVALLAALQALDALCVHLLCHLLVASLLLLGSSLILDALDVGLNGKGVVSYRIATRRRRMNEMISLWREKVKQVLRRDKQSKLSCWEWV